MRAVTNRLKIGTKLSLLAALGVVATLVISIVSYSSLRTLTHSNDRVSKLGNAAVSLADVQVRVNDVETFISVIPTLPPSTVKGVLPMFPADFTKINKDLATFDAQQLRDFDSAAIHTAAADYIAAADALSKQYASKPVFDYKAGSNVYTLSSTLNTKIEKMRTLLAKSSTAAVKKANHDASVAVTTLWISLGLGVALLAGISVWIRGSIVGPLRAAVEALRSVAKRDYTTTLPVRGSDEVAQLGTALNEAVADVRHVVGTVADSARSLEGAADRLAAVSEQVGSSSERTSSEAASAAAAYTQVNSHVSSVAAGAQEMTASISEIARNSAEAAAVAAEAVAAAQDTTVAVGRLGDSSAEIGNVVRTITGIAEQTNLLALNATIEAARAGDAGRGFAVVAGEVKDLAQETARATEDISRRVAAIQADTEGAVSSIERISHVIAQISDFQATIAAAVEEQTATTDEMSRTVGDVATRGHAISQSVDGVATAATSTAEGAAATEASARELRALAGELTGVVAQFRY